MKRSSRFTWNEGDVMPLASGNFPCRKDRYPAVDLATFAPVAIMQSHPVHEAIWVGVLDTDRVLIPECVYIWLTPDGEAVRVGTSEAPLWSRLRRYSGHINTSLEGRKSVTPQWEALLWLEAVKRHGYLAALAYQPQMIEGPAGPLRPFLDIERMMIRMLKPCLNRSRR